MRRPGQNPHDRRPALHLPPRRHHDRVIQQTILRPAREHRGRQLQALQTVVERGDGWMPQLFHRHAGAEGIPVVLHDFRVEEQGVAFLEVVDLREEGEVEDAVVED